MGFETVDLKTFSGITLYVVVVSLNWARPFDILVDFTQKLHGQKWAFAMWLEKEILQNV